MNQSRSGEKKLGIWTTTSLVVGNMVGAGIFLIPATLAAYGSISLVGWIFSAGGAVLIAVVLARLSKMLPGISGGPYTFTRKGFGDFTGFLVAWGYWISVWTSNAAIAVSLVSALSTFFPVLHTEPVAAVLTGLAAIWLLTWVNSLGIVTSGTVQLVTSILKVVPLVLIAMVGLFLIHRQNFFPVNISGSSDFSAIIAATTTTFFAFLGVECATIPAEKVANPEKLVPRATLYGTILVSLVYILGTFTLMGIIPPAQLQHSYSPFADVADRIWGPAARNWVAGTAVIASFGALNGWILIQGQMPHAAARDKLFPPLFARENASKSPVAGIVLSSVLVSVLMVMNFTKGLVEQFHFLILLSTLTCLVPYLFSMAAFVLLLVDNRKKGERPHHGSILLGLLAFGFTFWAIAGCGENVVYPGFLSLIAGIPVYLWMRWYRNKSS